MIHRIYQTRFGEEGNCFSACMASMFGGTIEDWDFCSNDKSSWREDLFREKGLSILEIQVDKVTLGLCGVDENFIIGVKSPSGLMHAVIARNHTKEHDSFLSIEIIHDPISPNADFSFYEDQIINGEITLLIPYRSNKN